ncbi:MAG TPA: hypothetical protein VEC37_12490, partial [Bacillota bacterium]|nr:hypothetical protein [Bacillota bacterium]
MEKIPRLAAVTLSLGLIVVLMGAVWPKTENWAGAAMKEKSTLNLQSGKVVPFKPDQVKLTNPDAVNAFQKELAYLKSLNVDR